MIYGKILTASVPIKEPASIVSEKQQKGRIAMERAAKKSKYYMFIATLLCICFLMGSSTAVWAGSRKAARIREKFLTGDDNHDSYYGVSFDFIDKGKIGKKNSFSGKFIIQKSMIPNNRDVFFVLPEVECYKKKGGRAGSLYPRSMILILKNKRKYEAYYIAGGSIREAGKKVSVKADSKELTIHVKNLPLYADNGLARNKTYTLSPTVWFMTGSNQNARKYVDTDEVTLNAEKKHTTTFDKKDFKYLHAMRSDGYPINVRLVNR